MNTKNKQYRLGSSLKDGKAHQEEHQNWSRRSFLSSMGITGAASMMLGNFSVNSLSAAGLSQALNQTETEKILVLIQLKGGNDGLNTMVPLNDYGFYRQQRPDIAIPENQLIKLSSEVGMPRSMKALENMWKDGRMKVIHDVGYPDQNLSHFRSTDIWTTASNSNETISDGWLGRYIGDQIPDIIENPPTTPPAIQIGAHGNLLFSFNNSNLAVSVADPEELFEIAKTGQLYETQSLPSNCYGNELKFLRTVANSTFKYAEIIKEAYDRSSISNNFPDSEIGEQLGVVARLVKGNLGTKLYKVSIDGFDTHANQNEEHPYLWLTISEALEAFFNEIEQAGLGQQVLAMTFSEFGRRIEENASLGTDHGTSAPLLLFGSGLNGNGFVGKKANMRDPDQYGNLKFQTDFRQVYSTVLEQWMCIDPISVNSLMGGEFDRLNLGFNNATPVLPGLENRFKHDLRYDPENGLVQFHYELATRSRLRLQIVNAMGQVVKNLKNTDQSAGSHMVSLNYRSSGISPGHYYYRFEVNGQLYSRSMVLYK